MTVSKRLRKTFDNDKKFILGVTDYLDELGVPNWIKQESSGTYRIAKKGKNNTITRRKQTVNFGI